MTQGGELRLRDLPDVCILEVLKKLDERSAVSFQSSSKWLLKLCHWPRIWADKLECLCGLKMPSWHLKDTKELQKGLRELDSALKHLEPQDGGTDEDLYPSGEHLSFHGLVTDGGMQDGQTSYWMGNIFEHGLSKGYCSAGKLNRAINCVAVYIPYRALPGRGVLPLRHLQQTRSSESKLYPGVLDERENHLFDERVIADLRNCAELPLNLSILRRVVVCRKGRFSCPITSGSLSIGSENWREVVSKGGHVDQALSLYSKAKSGYVPVLGGLKTLEEVLNVCEQGTLSASTVSWDGTGEWVEFESRGFGPRPVVWFHFFDETEYGNRQNSEESDRRARLTERFIKLGAVCRTVHLNYQKIFKARTFDAVDRNRMAMTLSKPVPGNSLYISLNSFEDIMDQCTWDQSKGPNVDIGKIYLCGSKEISIFGS